MDLRSLQLYSLESLNDEHCLPSDFSTYIDWLAQVPQVTNMMKGSLLSVVSNYKV